MNKALFFPLQVSLCTVSCLYASSSITQAQVTSDGTVNTQVNQDGNSAVITGGETRGSNLFHSFQDFSVPTGNEAFFNNANDISNIFSRVTGGNISNIDGAIRANGSASLFLINPAGIIFGANARLDIGGSFYGSTASSILFEDGEFSAADLENPPLLTVNAPIGLGFRDNPGDIIVRGNGQGTRLSSDLIDTNDALRVDSNKTLALAGGNLLFEGATIKTAGGRIELGSVEGNEQVSLTPVNEGFSLDFEGVQNFRDIQLSQAATIDASGENGGNIIIFGNDVNLTDTSQIESSILASPTSPGNGGVISVNATGTLNIDGSNSEGTSSGIFGSVYTVGEGESVNIAIFSGESVELSNGGNIQALVLSSATGNGGNITFDTPNLMLSSGGNISASNLGNGNAGNISINSSESVIIDDSTIFNIITANAVGNAGSTDINTTNLSITNSGFISTSTLGTGNGGNTSINASGSINVDNGTILNIVGEDAVGNAGLTDINTTNLSLTNGGLIDSRALGVGDSGNVSINATESVFINSAIVDNEGNVLDNPATGIFNQASQEGNVGDVNITTTNLSLTRGGFINARSSGNGDSGNISINATESVLLDGTILDDEGNAITSEETGILNEVAQEGNSGDINITTANFTLTNDATINASIFGKGNGGDISINASGTSTVRLFSSIFNGINSGGEGNAGDININTNNFSLETGSFVSPSTLGTGNGGNLSINATESFSIKSGSNIFNIVGRNAEGNAGTINIDTKNFDLNGSAGTIDARTFGIGDSGNIVINASESFTSSNNGRLDNSVELGAIGDAGDITIDTARFVAKSDGGGVDSSTNGMGDGGNISINATESISISSRRSISSRVGEDAEGDGGTINLNTARLELIDGGGINGDINGQGNGSDIFINASESISIVGTQRENVDNTFTGISSIVNGSGEGGEINLSTTNLIISDSGVINTATFELGNAGDIVINASTSIVIDGRRANFSSGIFSRVSSDAEGRGGNLNLSTPSLNLTNGGQISAETRGSGNAGNVNIDTIGISNLEGLDSGIFSRTGSTGNAGIININTFKLKVEENAQIGVNNFIETDLQITSEGITRIFDPVEGSGNSGTLEITSETIQIENGGSITAISAGGDGGNINLNSDVLRLRNGSNISTSAGLQNTPGSGGDITIDSQFIVAFPQGNNDITANAFTGEGGNITIATEGIFGIQERTPSNLTNDINASSQVSGLDGTISISTPDTNPIQGATELPTDVIVPEETSQQACEANREIAAQNGLNIKGKGGIVPEPGLPLNSLNIAVNGETNSTSVIPQPIETSQGKIQPARGIKVTESGKVILTAYRTNNSGERLPEIKQNCGQV